MRETKPLKLYKNSRVETVDDLKTFFVLISTNSQTWD